MLERLAGIDRRYIYLLVLVCVGWPLIRPFPMTITPSQPVIDVYQFLEKLPAGSTIVMGFDYGPSSAPELDPMAVSMLNQCFRRGIRVVALTLWAEGKPFMDRDLRVIGDQYHKTYGVDYVDLGFQVGGFVVIKNLGAGFSAAFPTDAFGHPLSTLPLMQEVKGFHYQDVAGVLDISVGDPGIKDWIKIVVSEYNRPVGGGCTAVWFPECSPFLQSGQLFGLIGGLRGAAEYEKLVGNKGFATAGMSAQSVVHVMMVALIVLSNVIYFSGRKRMHR